MAYKSDTAATTQRSLLPWSPSPSHTHVPLAVSSQYSLPVRTSHHTLRAGTLRGSGGCEGGTGGAGGVAGGNGSVGDGGGGFGDGGGGGGPLGGPGGLAPRHKHRPEREQSPVLVSLLQERFEAPKAQVELMAWFEATGVSLTR